MRVIILILLLISQQALADATYAPANSSISLPPTLNLSGNVTIGQTIWKSTPVATTMKASSYDGQSTLYTSINNSTLIMGKDVYATNLKGIGIRWWASWTSDSFLNLTNPLTNGMSSPGAKFSTPTTGKEYIQVIWFELVKTGPIQAGRLAISNSVELVFSCPCSNRWNVTVTGSSSVAQAPTCSLSAPVPQVPLGRMSTTTFNGIGSRSSPILFAINLTCTGGDPGVGIGSYITLTDASNPGNVSGVLSLDSKSTASGIGIQITNESGIVKFGPDSGAAGNTNQWKAGNIQPGMTALRIPLRASYIQTGAKATPGKATGQVSFTFSFH